MVLMTWNLEPVSHRKGLACILAIDEQQALETLTREEKTVSRLYAQMKEKQEDLEKKKEVRITESQKDGGK